MASSRPGSVVSIGFFLGLIYLSFCSAHRLHKPKNLHLHTKLVSTMAGGGGSGSGFGGDGSGGSNSGGHGEDHEGGSNSGGHGTGDHGYGGCESCDDGHGGGAGGYGGACGWGGEYGTGFGYQFVNGWPVPMVGPVYIPGFGCVGGGGRGGACGPPLGCYPCGGWASPDGLNKKDQRGHKGEAHTKPINDGDGFFTKYNEPEPVPVPASSEFATNAKPGH